ncbi:M48 family metalloprotease [Lyngbya sp. PCC 8106]|uniref:M48 family metalloprotease n=1 Tax=Lyngbya sp. (strain PCC 8106) TaxID=313612 RepID=UPI0000EAC3A4|nr:M48 family metalloprotease [Lyngbya sp. PCC 8106]EAW38484.1 hypothetical protein L8106_06774 [Lyngbya sp. PCC 8106]
MNFIKTTALLGFLTGLIILMGYLLIGGVMGAGIGLVIAIGINFYLWFHSDKIVLSVYQARSPNSPEKKLLDPIVKLLCYRADLPVPKVYIIPSSMANAFASGRNPENSVIGITEGLLRMLPEDELEAVIAHEISHIKHRDPLIVTIAATLAGAISLLTQLGTTVFLGSIFNLRSANPLRQFSLLITVLLAPITATLIRLSISRTREYAADAGAASLTGNPRALAKALERIEKSQKVPFSSQATYASLLIINPFQGKMFNQLFSTHPSTESRIQQLLGMQTRQKTVSKMNNNYPLKRHKRLITSTILASLVVGLAYAPIPGLEQKIMVVSGSELAEPLQQLETKFEQQYPNINLELKFQGSQDMVNNYIHQNNDFQPTVLIPASQEFLEELSQRWQASNDGELFYKPPQAIAKTFLVGIAWLERGKILFPNNQFSWQRIEQAMQAKTWDKMGGQENWGSFDFVMTDPTRSNSGQVTLSLWLNSKQGNSLNLNTSSAESLFKMIEQSVYQPPRSTDILLQEFITRGPNDADVTTVYESIALSRWQQAGINQSRPYQIYYLNPTIESVATAAILRHHVNLRTAHAASKFVDFLSEPEQQKVFVQYGFRPVNSNVNLESVANSPWNQHIPGAQVNPQISVLDAPQPNELREIQRLWQRVSP